LAFDYPTINDLTQYIAKEVFLSKRKTQELISSNKKNIKTTSDNLDVQQLSEDEAEQALLNELEKSGF